MACEFAQSDRMSDNSQVYSNSGFNNIGFSASNLGELKMQILPVQSKLYTYGIIMMNSIYIICNWKTYSIWHFHYYKRCKKARDFDPLISEPIVAVMNLT
jgi:hypothetical protein